MKEKNFTFASASLSRPFPIGGWISDQTKAKV